VSCNRNKWNGGLSSALCFLSLKIFYLLFYYFLARPPKYFVKVDQDIFKVCLHCFQNGRKARRFSGCSLPGTTQQMSDFQQGLFGCFSECTTCLLGCFVPCYLTGKTQADVDQRQCTFCDCLCCANPYFTRQQISGCDDDKDEDNVVFSCLLSTTQARIRNAGTLVTLRCRAD
jgi:Cys-rich protein (TIGR01571 family)